MTTTNSTPLEPYRFSTVFEGGQSPVGHSAEWVGGDHTPIYALEPPVPAEGSLRATLVSNGAYDFTVTRYAEDRGAFVAQDSERFTNGRGEITARIEAIIAAEEIESLHGVAVSEALRTGDLCAVGYDGTLYTVEWRNNAWFETFIDAYESGSWVEVSYEVTEDDACPAADDARATLEAAIDLARSTS